MKRKKIVGLLIAFVAAMAALINGYLLFFRNNSQKEVSTNTSQESGSSSSSTTAASSTTSDSSSSDLKDGTYTGASTSTKWGDVQVQITVKSGKITAIDVLKSPDTENKSIMINEEALPTYKSEALAAQSAEIDQVSGATETYNGFTGSLQSAITQAETGTSTS
ncbi:FMN-binding protein [Streptococcus ferus]|uniref:FMN-binding protein n=1 Tax=Streptococcus ferus TaxID=1345 RepID=UPI002352F6DD|nr:FMN-binding protein [Streptococcus ferus]